MLDVATKLKPSREEFIEDNRILVFDDLVDRKKIVHYNDLFCLSDYTFLHSSRFDTKKYREWMADFDVSDFVQHELYQVALLAASQFSETPLNCYSAFCNAITYGDQTFAHYDSENFENISVLYYANESWKNEWNGETVFYSEDMEPKVAIGVKPGRVIVFGGGVYHRAGVPSRLCPDVRLTLSVRFEPKQA